jgi:glucokinase
VSQNPLAFSEAHLNITLNSGRGKDSVFSNDTLLALDIGCTNVKSGLISRGGDILKYHSFPTSDGWDPNHLIDFIALNLKTLWNESMSAHRPKALAIGAPGWIKPKEGIVVMAPNIPGWKGLHITKLMSQALDISTVLENNDTQCIFLIKLEVSLW